MKKNVIIVAGLLFLCGWCFLIYANTFHVPFLFDDEDFIVRDPQVRHFLIRDFFRQSIYLKRLVVFLFFALNYLWGGTQVIGYHLVNVGIHVANVFCVAWFLLLLLQTPRMRDDPLRRHALPWAFFVAWLFASHPIQTESVTYISQRFESLSAFFYMSSLCCYLHARLAPGVFKQKAFFLGSFLLAFLGFFSKESVFTLPLAFLMIEWIFFKAFSEKAEMKRHWKIWILAGLFFLAMSVLFIMILDLRAVFRFHESIGISKSSYFFTQCRVVFRYILMLLFPMHQTVDHDSPWVTSFNLITAVHAWVLLSMVFLGLCATRNSPLIGFGILWFFLTLLPTSSFIPIKDAMVEHRLYLPLLGYLLVISAGVYALMKDFKFYIIFMTLLVFMLSSFTFLRNQTWTHEIAFWKDAVSKAPLKARPYANLGIAYNREGKPQKALQAYKLALRFQLPDKNSLSKIYTNMSAAYGELKRYTTEINFCRKAIKLDPLNFQAFSNLCYALALMGKYKQAIYNGERAVKINKRFDEGWNNLGVAWALHGSYKEAALAFRQALAVNPRNEQAKRNLERATEYQQQSLLPLM